MTATIKIINGTYSLVFADGRRQKFSELAFLVDEINAKSIEVENTNVLPDFYQKRLKTSINDRKQPKVQEK